MREMKALLSPFLSLMKEKEAKENQGIRDACQVGWVLQTRQREAGEVVRVVQTKQRDLCQVAGDNHALEKSTRLTVPLSIGCTFRSCRFAIPFYSLLRLSTGLALAARQF